MKCFIFLLGTIMISYSSVRAQTILPFVQDGKKWIYEARNYNDLVWEEIFSLEGDTVIDSRKCMKLYFTNTCPSPPYISYNHFYKGALFDEGSKIYIISPENTTPVLLYDFSSEPGTVVKVGEFEVRIVEKKLVKYRGELLKDVYYVPDDEDGDFDWIEGVGVLGGANLTCFIDGFGPWYTGGISRLKTCMVNGKVVFDLDEYLKTVQIVTGIRKPLICMPEEADITYNLAGQRVSKLAKGIYIQNGRKVAVK